MDLRPTTETDPQGWDRRRSADMIRWALSQVPAKRQVARRSLANVLAHLGGREIHHDCHGATLKLQTISIRTCPEAKGGI